MPEFTRYAPLAGSHFKVPNPSADGRWMRPFMESMEPFLAYFVLADARPRSPSSSRA